MKTTQQLDTRLMTIEAMELMLDAIEKDNRVKDVNISFNDSVYFNPCGVPSTVQLDIIHD